MQTTLRYCIFVYKLQIPDAKCVPCSEVSVPSLNNLLICPIPTIYFYFEYFLQTSTERYYAGSIFTLFCPPLDIYLDLEVTFAHACVVG